MVRTRGDLALQLPGLVAEPDEEVTEVVVQLDSDVEPGDIYLGYVTTVLAPGPWVQSPAPESLGTHPLPPPPPRTKRITKYKHTCLRVFVVCVVSAHRYLWGGCVQCMSMGKPMMASLGSMWTKVRYLP